jgi:hypothetical protein
MHKRNSRRLLAIYGIKLPSGRHTQPGKEGGGEVAFIPMIQHNHQYLPMRVTPLITSSRRTFYKLPGAHINVQALEAFTTLYCSDRYCTAV